MTAPTPVDIRAAIEAASMEDGVGQYTDTLGGLHANLTGLTPAVATPLVQSAAYTLEG